MKRGLLVAAGIAVAGVAWAQTPIVQFSEPRDGVVVTEPRVTVTGRTEAQKRPTAAFDVVVVIDTSGSTKVPASVAAAAGPTGIFTGPLGIPLGGPTILHV